jgi:hypothetical protein
VTSTPAGPAAGFVRRRCRMAAAIACGGQAHPGAGCAAVTRVGAGGVRGRPGPSGPVRRQHRRAGPRWAGGNGPDGLTEGGAFFALGRTGGKQGREPWVTVTRSSPTNMMRHLHRFCGGIQVRRPAAARAGHRRRAGRRRAGGEVSRPRDLDVVPAQRRWCAAARSRLARDSALDRIHPGLEAGQCGPDRLRPTTGSTGMVWHRSGLPPRRQRRTPGQIDRLGHCCGTRRPRRGGYVIRRSLR